MKVGDKYNTKFLFTQEDVNKFAELTGDNNPIHLDKNYAQKSQFGCRIMHGFLSASIFSKVFGTAFPGNAIYLEQNLKFQKPMHCNREYTAQFKVLEVKNSNIIKVSTIIAIYDTKYITGTAIIKV